MKQLARRYLPDSASDLLRSWYYRYPAVRRAYYFPLDLMHRLRRSSSNDDPPPSRNFVGSGDFKAIGEEFVRHFIERCDLRPDESVLEVGCGIGRIALPLAKYMSPDGRYVGIDIVPEGIRWCDRNITSKFANFRFILSDVFNEQYNPGGSVAADEYTFPFPDRSFDFVFLTSVFTHMKIADISNYLSEINRVLRPSGRLLSTFFLLNDGALDYIARNRTPFKYAYGDSLVADRSIPEISIAHPEAQVRDLYRRNGLNISEPIHFGRWCGQPRPLSYQDIVIATKGR